MDTTSTSPALVVSLHDAHPGSIEKIRGQLCALKKWGVERASILMVPEWHHESRTVEDARTIELANGWQADGHELVLHGYYHDRVGLPTTAGNLFWTKFYTSSESEFLDLVQADTEKRLLQGREMFARLKWNCRGFIAPAWLMAPNVTGVLRKEGFLYTNTLREFLPLNQPEPVATQSLCWSTRAAWRRWASLRWNKILLNRLLRERPPLLRISLHPKDLTYPEISRQIEACVKRALQSGYKPTTYAEYAAG